MPRTRKPKPTKTSLPRLCLTDVSPNGYDDDAYRTMPQSFVRFVEVQGLKDRVIEPEWPSTMH